MKTEQDKKPSLFKDILGDSLKIKESKSKVLAKILLNSFSTNAVSEDRTIRNTMYRTNIKDN